MSKIIFSNAAILFYVFVLITELITKYGITQTEKEGESRMLALGDVCGFLALGFLIFYSASTAWWAFIALLIANVVIYKTIFLVFSRLLRNKRLNYVSDRFSRFILIPIGILMFILV